MLQYIFTSIKDVRFSEKSVPWVLLTSSVLAYGLLISKLGYFQDDWAYVYNYYMFGQDGIINFLAYDGRPFAAWVYIIGFNIFGYKPLLWHIAILTVRWLTACLLWASLRLIWPTQKWQNLTTALFFIAYPFFTLQPLAVAYTLHWTGYLLYSLSIYFMLLSLKKRFWLFTMLALATQAMHLFTLEFYSGIDLLRPIFIWVTLSTVNLSSKVRLKIVLQKWTPYLVVFIFFFIWRGFFYQALEAGRNAPVGLTAFLNNPFTTVVSIIMNAIPDLVLILISSWYEILKPSTFNFNVTSNLYAFFLSVAIYCFFFLYFSKQNSTQEGSESSERQMLTVGIFAFLLGLLPIYAAGFEIYNKLAPWNSRFSLGSLFGAALIITALIDYIVKTPKTRWIIISALIGLLINWHLSYTNDFRWVWDKQVNFYRQLYLRAPSLTPNTAILAEEEFLMYMGNYSTSYGINLIYENDEHGNPNKTRQADYWFITFVEFISTFDAHLNGEPFSIGKQDEVSRAGITFQSEPEGSIVVSFEPGLGQCLWVMRPEYANSKTLSQTMRQLVSISYIDRIKNVPENPDSFLLKYLYTKTEQDWCYYYEKADLAYQYEEWNEIINLWEVANKNGLKPDNGFEYIPFIEAFARSGDWDTAKKMTRTSKVTMQGIDPLLCTIWSDIGDETPLSQEKEYTLVAVMENLKCNQE